MDGEFIENLVEIDAMMWVLGILVAGVLLWRGNDRRGKRFVRSVRYIMLVDTGFTNKEATREAMILFSKLSTPQHDVAAIEYAQSMAKRMTNGRQQPWIQAAIEKGFDERL